jgi:hypothetical protein
MTMGRFGAIMLLLNALLAGGCSTAEEELEAAPAEDVGGSEPDALPNADAFDGDVELAQPEYDGQCADVFGPGLVPPVGFEQFTRADQDRQCAFRTGCDTPSWFPGYDCPDWLPAGQSFICALCWNEQCIDVGAFPRCPEPPYEYVANPQVLGDCGAINPNREEHSPEVLAALDRICAVADDCAEAVTGDCEERDAFTAGCFACFNGLCESVASVIPCTPPTPEDAWP